MGRFYLLIIILAGGFLVHALRLPHLPFDSDQAVVGLMAKHILEGAFPWLYYGDSYGGTLEPLLAAVFFFFGSPGRATLQAVPLVFYSLFVLSIYQWGREMFDEKVGLVGMLLAALPIFQVGFYSSLAYGGYIEVLWLGNLMLLMTYRLSSKKRSDRFMDLFFLSLLWGVAWWTYPISAVYLAACGFLLIIYRFDLLRSGRFWISPVGFLLGSLPFWLWNGAHRFPFLSFSTSEGNPDYFYRLHLFFRKFIEFFTVPLPSPLAFLGPMLAGIFLVSLLALSLGEKRLGKRVSEGHGAFFLYTLFLVFGLFYLGTRFSEQNASRYLLPLFSIVPLSLAVMIRVVQSTGALWGAVLLVLVISVLGVHQFSLCRYLKHTSLRYQKQLEVEERLFAFLRQKQHNRAYVPEYWSAVELTFNAQEKPVFTQPFRDRFPYYTLQADARPDPVFVLDGRYPASFEAMFRAMGGSFCKSIISLYPGVKGYVVYEGFTPPPNRFEELLPEGWKGKSSPPEGLETQAFDRKRLTFWSTETPQREGMFFQVDVGGVAPLNRLVLLCAKGRERDFPSYFRVELSSDGRTWREVASVNNHWAYLFWSDGRPFWKLREGRTEIVFPPQEARFIRITLSRSAPHPWSIGEIFIYRPRKGLKPASPAPQEILSFLNRKGIEYVYADIGLSAQLTHLSRGKIKCLQDDYDLTRGEDYRPWGYNGLYPFYNRLERKVDLALNPAFIVQEENRAAFVDILKKHQWQGSSETIGDKTIFFGLRPDISRKGGERPYPVLYWSGTHLLETGP
jgi:hypothetical protein